MCACARIAAICTAGGGGRPRGEASRVQQLGRRISQSNDLIGLRKEYHENIHDGTQWVLWIKQGEREKSVYFNNNFPHRIKAFAKQLDAILEHAGLDKAAWQPVPQRNSRQHERELWDSIRR